MKRHAASNRWTPGVVRALSLLALLAFTAPAFAAPPIVYHSELDDGVAPPGGVEIPGAGTTTVHLYVAGGSNVSTQPVCAQGTGDEICGFRLAFGTTGGLSLSSFAPAAGVDFHLDGSTLVVLGGNPWRGRLGPIKIGDVDVQGPGGATLELATGQSVNAALGLEALAPATLVTVPEPSLVSGLIAGGLLLSFLRGRRRRSVASQESGRFLLLAAVCTCAFAAGPRPADAQPTPICGDVVADDVLDVQDLDTLSAFLVGDPGAPDLQNDPVALARCDVAPNGQCDVQDYARMRRSLLGLVGGMDETCVGVLPSSVELPTPTLDQASTITTDRASVVLSGTARFPVGRIDVVGAEGRPWTGVSGDGSWRIEVPVPLAQSTWLSVTQDLGGGQSSPTADVLVNQTTATGAAKISGQIVDAATGLPLFQVADLAVAGNAYQTDEFGRFELEGLPEGYLAVRASLPGYVPALQLAYAGAVALPLEDTDANHVPVEIALTQRAATVTIDSAGGTVVTPSGIQLVVPPGSLATPTDIALTELLAGPRHDFAGTSIVDIGPGPIVFAPPAMLRIPIDASLVGQTFDLLQVDDSDASASPTTGVVVAPGFIEVPVESSNGDWAAYEWHLEFSGIVPGGGDFQLVTSTLSGDCVADRIDKPFFDRKYEFLPDPINSDVVPDLVSDLQENPWRAAWWVASEVNVFSGGVDVPLGGQVTYQWTVTTRRQRFDIVLDAYPDGEASAGIVVGTLLIDTPVSALPNFLEARNIECKKPKGGAWGDPHLIRFDHIGEALASSKGDGRFDFQASGEFVLFESTRDGMVVQARFEALPARPSVTITTALAFDVAGDRVMVDDNGGALEVRVEGLVTSLTVGVPYLLPGGGELERIAPVNAQDELVVRWPDTSTLSISLLSFLGSAYLNVYPELAPGRFGQVKGLLGNANGIIGDDLNLRDGTPSDPADLYTTYASSWRISQFESLFDYEPGEDTTTYNGIPPDPDFDLDDLDPAERAVAEGVCIAAGITEDPLLSECALDVALLGGAAAGSALETLDQVPDVGTYVAVSGQANVFQAGQGSPIDFGGGGGPGLLPTEFPLPAGADRTLRVLDFAGSISMSTDGAAIPPDGVDYGDIVWTSWGDVSALRSQRLGQTLGVFLDGGLPASVPAGFDCGAVEGAFSSPEIGQVFCLGNGLSATNEPQTFFVPDGATRLFLGFGDRLSSQLLESEIHHLGDNFGTAGLFSLAPNPEGSTFASDPFDLPSAFTPSSARVMLDLVGTNLTNNSVWVNGQFAGNLPLTGTNITVWTEDVSIAVAPSLLSGSGNVVEVRSAGGDLDDFLFKDLRIEVVPPFSTLPGSLTSTPFHLGDDVGSGGLFALAPVPLGLVWESPPFDAPDRDLYPAARVVLDVAETDFGTNRVLLNGTFIGYLPYSPNNAVWNSDVTRSFDPALLRESGNRITIQVNSSPYDDFMVQNVRVEVPAIDAVPPGGYSDNAGVHELIIEVSP